MEQDDHYLPNSGFNGPLSRFTHETGFDHVYSVSNSLNKVLIVVSGKFKSFSPRIITKVMIHPMYILASSSSGHTF